MNSRVRQRSVVVGAAGVLIVSSACMVGPMYVRPGVPAPPAFKEALPAGWKGAQPNDGAIRGKWWTVYSDPRLEALEDQVSISNQNVLAADAQFRAAVAAVRITRAGLFPTVSASPSATGSGTGAAAGAQRQYSIPLDVAYQTDVWGSIRRSVTANSAVAQASAADLENARLLYQGELATDYFQIQGLDAVGHLLDATVKSYEEYVQLTQDRYEGGVASMGDVALARTQLEAARAQFADLGVQRAQFEHAIAVLTGKPPSALSIPAAPSQSPPPAMLIGLPSTLLERRPDVATAERLLAGHHGADQLAPESTGGSRHSHATDGRERVSDPGPGRRMGRVAAAILLGLTTVTEQPAPRNRSSNSRRRSTRAVGLPR
jgi:NodT family efflux transporter outer membrane factor (OMF) lipoprotein